MTGKISPGAVYWSKLTPQQRSVEMMRRQEVSRKRRLAEQRDRAARGQTSSPSPFPSESTDSVSLKQRIAALEESVAQLKKEIGL